MTLKLKIGEMNKYLKKNNRYKIIIFVILFSISFFITSTFERFNFGNRTWNFQWTYKLLNGYKIYKDVEIIVTPLYFVLELLTFKIFSANYISVHLINALINTVMYFMVYEILEELLKSKKKSIFLTIIIILCTCSILFDGGAYTSLASIFYLLGILLKIKKKSNWITDGIILFLIFFSKQNIAVLYGLSLLVELAVLRKEKWKYTFLYLLKSALIFSAFLACFLIYLYFNNSLYDFINYCFLGMVEFTKNIKIGITIVEFIYIVFCGNFLYLINKKKNKDSLKIDLLYVYSIFLVITAFPIIDELHLSFGSIPFIILTLVLADSFFNDETKRKIINYFITAICIITFISSIVFNIIYFYHFGTTSLKYDVYKGSYYLGNSNSQNKIEEVVNYIKNSDKKVIILSFCSAKYNNVLEENNGILDMPFLGNLGREGEEGLIKKVSELKDTYVLIVKDEKQMLWQESKNLRNYIINNFTYKGEINEFLIYETN